MYKCQKCNDMAAKVWINTATVCFTFKDIITNISSYSSQQKHTDCDGEFESDYVWRITVDFGEIFQIWTQIGLGMLSKWPN